MGAEGRTQQGPGASERRGVAFWVVSVVVLAAAIGLGVAVALYAARPAQPPPEDTLEAVRLTNERLLTLPEGDWARPAWRPDGNAVVASKVETQGSQLWLIPLDGTPPIQLTFGSGSHVTASGRAWSPKGLLYSSDESGERDVYLLDVTSFRSRRVGWDDSEDVDPTWSPDGRSVVFSRRSFGAEWFAVWTASLDPPQPPRAVSPKLGSDARRPEWSPNGTRILFEFGLEGQRDLFTLETGRPARTRTPTATATATASAAPTNSAAATWTVMPLVATTGDQTDGVWAGRGEDVIFADTPTATVAADLYVFADGVIRRLTQSPEAEAAPSVSPDGSRVAFEHGPAGQRRIAVADLVRGTAPR